MKYKLLNLACGSKVSNFGEWVNIDFQSPIEGVIEMNILNGLNFPDNYFDVVYSAQFIEHLTLQEAKSVFSEVLRVMKPGGILRIVTPDLEEMAMSYLKYLKRLGDSPERITKNKYDWLRIEIFDQIVRDKSGGDTHDFINNADQETRDFLINRLGLSGKNLFENNTTSKNNFSLNKFFNKFHKIPKKFLELLRSYMLPKTFKIGIFRKSGEIHRYLHDEFSLSHLLKSIGFESITRVNPIVSSINDWSQYNLDKVDGIIDGPRCLYVEARKSK